MLIDCNVIKHRESLVQAGGLCLLLFMLMF